MALIFQVVEFFKGKCVVMLIWGKLMGVDGLNLDQILKRGRMLVVVLISFVIYSCMCVAGPSMCGRPQYVCGGPSMEIFFDEVLLHIP